MKWTEYYEQYEGSFGGRLLPYKDNHILVAVIIYRETGIQPNIIGRSHKEVGLMQVHGIPLDGFKRKEVINNPELGVHLGIQWLAYCTTRCNHGRRKPNDWHYALTQYGASPQAAGSGRNCKILGYARIRIRLAKKSRTKMNATSL